MNKPPETDKYLPCLRCDVWVPGYAKEIHASECHELLLKSFSHPYILGSSLFTHVNIIGVTEQQLKERKAGCKQVKASDNVEKEKESKKKKRNAAEDCSLKKNTVTEENHLSGDLNSNQNGEPEWLKKIFGAFHYRVVLVNERDLVRCNITAYSPVIVECANTSCAFLVIPDESIRIGHASLHHRSLEKYLPSVSNNSSVWIKKITNVKFVDEIEVFPSRVLLEKESKIIVQQLKSLLFSNFPIGAPFTLCLGSTVYLSSGTEAYEIVSFKLSAECDETIVTDRNIVRKMKDLNIQSVTDAEKSESVPSELITLDECVASETTALARDLSKLQVSDANISGTFVTVDEVKEDSLDVSDISHSISQIISNLRTSTPNKLRDDGSERVFNSLLISGIDSEETSALRTHSSYPEDLNTSQKCDLWVRVGRHTKVTIHKSCIERGKAATHATEQTEKYCEDNTYILLKKLMQNIRGESGNLGNPLLGGWGGVLLYGPPGTGKTLMVKQAAEELGIPVVSLTLSDIIEAGGNGEECVRRRFKMACDSAPSVLFLDEVDSLCPAGDQKIQRGIDHTSAVVQGFQTLKDSARSVFIVGASSRPQALHPKLRCSGRMDREIMVPLPDAHHRVSILSHLLSRQRHCLLPHQVDEVARKAYGFSGADLSVLLRGAWLSCVARTKVAKKPEEQDLCLTQDDLLEGLKGVVPTMLRHHYSALSMMKWSDIWGYQSIKSKLQMMVSEYIREPSDHPLKGTLLYGPPGCSKTMIVRALATETGFTFFSLKCSDLLSKYVGETEKSLNQVFVRAQQAAPALVFMDEVDSLCGDRGGTGMGAGGPGLVSELLTLMANRHGGVMVVASTNRPHVVDEALLRPGFLEQVIHVDLPDMESRKEIWQGLLRGVPTVGVPLDISKLSYATAGYSGAEISAIYQEAAHSVISQLSPSQDEQNAFLTSATQQDKHPVITSSTAQNSKSTEPSSTTCQPSIYASSTHDSQSLFLTSALLQPSVPSQPFIHASTTQQEEQPHVAVSEELLLRTIQANPPRTPASLLKSISAFRKQRRGAQQAEVSQR